MRFLSSLSIALIASTLAWAQDSDPSHVSAVELADQGDFPAAFEQIAPGDETGHALVTWLRLREGAGDFADYLAFLEDYPDWPAQSRLRAEAERQMPDGLDPVTVLVFFAQEDPQTGQGAVRLAEALIAEDRAVEAQDVIIQAWTGLRLSDEDERALILESFEVVVAPHHLARADALLWRWRTEEATAMLELLSEDEAKLIAARLAYIQNDSVAEAVAEVPEALKDNVGLAYDRYSWLASRGNRTQAVALLRAKSTSAEALQEPFRWSGWRRSLARWEMREGRPERAYEVATQHFLTEGSSYADLEWVAGYIALRYLEDPALALEHFKKVAAAVDTPISLGRAGYWMARAHAALGDANAAAAAYAMAAEHQTGFYGLLAAEQLGMRLDPALTGRADIVDWEDSSILEDPLVIAALALLEGGERGYATVFFAHQGRQMDATEIGRLARLMEDLDDPFYSVLLGKAAAARGIIVPSAYFPLHDLIEMGLPVDPALALSIARRESEFNFRAGSPVGALGLMQLMPATAEEVAGFEGVSYSRARLTSDWQYNARLGARYLAELEAEFGPSPVQVSAGYNAGPSRPLAWMDERGDPRLGEVDVVDWIEHIPFRETRNYVMRVSESIPVYQARLSGQTGPVRFMALLLGEKPLVRPLVRPERDVPVLEAIEDVPVEDIPFAGPRPVARPDN